MACIENETSFETKNNANLQNVFETSHKAALSMKTEKNETSKVARSDTYKALQRLSDLTHDKPLLEKYLSEKSDHKKSSHDKKTSASPLSLPESLGDVIYEGDLKSKNTFNKSAYSADRTWKSVHAVLRGQCLCLHPDKNSQKLVVYNTPILMQSSFVDIAYDYTKRPNVFRLMTLSFCEFLFEAPSSQEMLQWIKVLQKASIFAHKSRKKALRGSLKRYKNKRSKSSSSSKPSNKHKTSYQTSQQQQQPVASYDKLENDDPTAATNDASTAKTLDITFDPHKNLDCKPNKQPALIASASAKQLQVQSIMNKLRSRSPDVRPHAQFSPPLSGSKADSKGKSWREKMLERFKRVHSHPGSAWAPLSALASTSPPRVDALKASIGVPLHLCVVSSANQNLPLLVEACIGAIEEGGCEGKGIYRVPGNNAAIALLQSEVDKDPEGLCRSHEKWRDINVVVGLLKLFFRKLPEPLATRELYLDFMEANCMQNKKDRLIKIKSLLHQLPSHNFETFKALSSHLHKVSTLHHTNMMDPRNLSIVFGPTLLQPPLHMDSMIVMVKDMTSQCQVVQSIITHYSWMFGEVGDGAPSEGDDEAMDDNVPVSSMQQQLIQKAQLHVPSNEKTSESTCHLAVPSSFPEGRDIKGSSLYSLHSVYADVGARSCNSGRLSESHSRLLKEFSMHKSKSHKDYSTSNKEHSKSTGKAHKNNPHWNHKAYPDTPSKAFKHSVRYIGECFRGSSADKDDEELASDTSPINPRAAHAGPPVIFVQSFPDAATNKTEQKNNNAQDFNENVRASLEGRSEDSVIPGDMVRSGGDGSSFQDPSETADKDSTVDSKSVEETQSDSHPLLDVGCTKRHHMRYHKNKRSNHANNQASSHTSPHSNSNFLLPPKITFKSKKPKSSGRKRGENDRSMKAPLCSSVYGGNDRMSDGVLNEDVTDTTPLTTPLKSSTKPLENELLTDKMLKDSVEGHPKLIRSHSSDFILGHSLHPQLKLNKVYPSSSHINFTYTPEGQKKKLVLNSPVFNKAMHKIHNIFGSCGRSVENGLSTAGDHADGEDDHKTSGRHKSFDSSKKGYLKKALSESQALVNTENKTNVKTLAFESAV